MTHLRNALFCAVLLASSAFSAAAGLRSCPPVCPTTGPSANFCNLGVSGSLCVGSTASVQGNLGVGGNLTVCGLVTAGGPRSVDTRSLIPGCSGLACTGPSLELEVLGSAGILDDLSVCGTETVNNLNVCNQTNLNNLTVFGTAVIPSIVIGTGTFINLNVSGNLSVEGTTTLGGTAPNCAVTGLTVNGNIQANCSETIAGGLNVSGPAGFNSPVSITDVTPSTACANGALVVAGGVGVGGDLNVCGSLSFSGPLVITDTTNSTACTNGAVVIAGGLGVGGDLNTCGTGSFGGNLNAAGNAVVGGDLGVTGNAVIVGNETVDGNLSVLGNEYLSGSLTATGVINANGGIDFPSQGSTGPVSLLNFYEEYSLETTFVWNPACGATAPGTLSNPTFIYFTRIGNIVVFTCEGFTFAAGTTEDWTANLSIHIRPEFLPISQDVQVAGPPLIQYDNNVSGSVENYAGGCVIRTDGILTIFNMASPGSGYPMPSGCGFDNLTPFLSSNGNLVQVNPWSFAYSIV